MRWAIRFIRKCRRGELWFRRLDALGAASLMLNKWVVHESEFTPDQMNGALFLERKLLAYRKKNDNGEDVWKVPSWSLLHAWAMSEAKRLGVDLRTYQPKRADSPGVNLIPVSDYQAPR